MMGREGNSPAAAVKKFGPNLHGSCELLQAFSRRVPKLRVRDLNCGTIDYVKLHTPRNRMEQSLQCKVV